MDADLEYLAKLYMRLRALDSGARTFRVVSPRKVANDQGAAVGENTNSESVGSKVKVAEPPGT